MAPAVRTPQEGAVLALWDTTGTEVVHKLAAERRSAGGVASGLALTLIVVADEPNVRGVEDAVTIAAAEHPCRLLVGTRRPADTPDTPTGWTPRSWWAAGWVHARRY